MSKSEISFLSGLIILILLAIFLPTIEQNQNYHNFADQRTLFGVRNALDTLSNLAFIMVGILGLVNYFCYTFGKNVSIGIFSLDNIYPFRPTDCGYL